jgi:hypothetical protein
MLAMANRGPNTSKVIARINTIGAASNAIGPEAVTSAKDGLRRKRKIIGK